MIPKKVLQLIKKEINDDVTAEIVVVYNYKGERWVRPSDTMKVVKGDTIEIKFNGIDITECNNITTTKKWWQFWK